MRGNIYKPWLGKRSAPTVKLPTRCSEWKATQSSLQPLAHPKDNLYPSSGSNRASIFFWSAVRWGLAFQPSVTALRLLLPYFSRCREHVEDPIRLG